MPIYEYIAVDPSRGCSYCRVRFENLEAISDQRLEVCPECGNPVQRCFSAPSVGASRSGLDDRAKNAGFHKLKKLGKGEYEKEY